MIGFIIIGIVAVLGIAAIIKALLPSYVNPLKADPNITHVIVKNGVNLKDISYGVEKGRKFGTDDLKAGTVLVNGQRRLICHMSFINQGTCTQENFSFSNKMKIGRTEETNLKAPKLVLENDKLVSKEHCLIYLQGNQVWISDMHSHNHTYLNGNQLTAPAQLNDGDVLTVGYTKLRIRFKVQ